MHTQNGEIERLELALRQGSVNAQEDEHKNAQLTHPFATKNQTLSALPLHARPHHPLCDEVLQATVESVR